MVFCGVSLFGGLFRILGRVGSCSMYAGVFQPVCTLIDPPGPVRAFLLVFWTVLALGVFNCARIVAIM